MKYKLEEIISTTNGRKPTAKEASKKGNQKVKEVH